MRRDSLKLVTKQTPHPVKALFNNRGTPDKAHAEKRKPMTFRKQAIEKYKTVSFIQSSHNNLLSSSVFFASFLRKNITINYIFI